MTNPYQEAAQRRIAERAAADARFVELARSGAASASDLVKEMIEYALTKYPAGKREMSFDTVDWSRKFDGKPEKKIAAKILEDSFYASGLES